MYVDFSFYANEYKGTLVPYECFDIYAKKACRYINYVTFNRAKNTDLIEYVKICACELLEFEYSVDLGSRDGKLIASESVGSQSESYFQPTTSIDQQRYNLVLQHLGNTGLMYRGV